jgi:hypothetical protein
LWGEEELFEAIIVAACSVIEIDAVTLGRQRKGEGLGGEGLIGRLRDWNVLRGENVCKSLHGCGRCPCPQEDFQEGDVQGRPFAGA